MNLSSPSEIKALLQKNGFNFSKALGQNFLIDPSVCPRMAEAAIPGPEYGVIEVGPGIGVLTVELAQRAQKVIAVELDSTSPARPASCRSLSARTYLTTSLLRSS